MQLKDLNRKWSISTARRMSFQKMRLYQYGLFHGYKEIFGRGQRFYLGRAKKGVMRSYTCESEMDNTILYLERKFSNAKYVIKESNRLGAKLQNEFRKCVEDVKKFPQNWKKSANAYLLEGLKNYYKIDNRVSGYYWILYNEFEKILTESAQKLMAKRGTAQDEIQKVLSILAQPALITPLDMERLSILRVALQKGSAQEKALLNHQEKFSFLPMYDIDYDPYSLAHFKKELAKIKNKLSTAKAKKEIDAILKKYIERKTRKNKVLKNYKSSPEVAAILRFFGTYADHKDRKPYVRDQISCAVKNLFAEIANRLGLSLTEVLFLTDAELSRALKGGKSISKGEAAARVKDSAILLKDDQVMIFSGKQDLKRIDKILEKKESLKELKGLGVSPGKVRGAAAIIISNADFPKFRKGQILIASATRPDFVPIMKNAAAIVTDEGGILSHAAIISRELEIPCVVGTKSATKVLKDGDKIEVDANKGTVKILK